MPRALKGPGQESFAGRPGERAATMWAVTLLMGDLGSELRPCGPQGKGGGTSLRRQHVFGVLGLGGPSHGPSSLEKVPLTLVSSGVPLRPLDAQ